MWRLQTSRQGKQILRTARRHLASESAGNAPPPPKTPSPSSGGRGFLKFLGISIPLAAGGVVGYAWYDPEFRRKMEQDVPFARETLEFLLSETPAPVSKSQNTELAPALDTLSKGIPPPPPIDSQIPLKDIETSSKEERQETPQRVEQEHEKIEVKSKPTKDEIQAELRKKAENEMADNAALEVVIHKLLTNSQRLAEMAVHAQVDVANATRNHTMLLRQAMNDSEDILHKDSQWEAVTVAFKEKENAILKCHELVADSKTSIQKLRDVLAESKTSPVTKNNPAINPATKRVAEITKELSKANTQVRQADSEAKVMSKYKDLVDKGRKQFQQELESIFPDVKVGTKSRKLTEEELNALIAHAHRRIEQLQKQIAEQMAMEKERLNTALELQKSEDYDIAKEMVEEEKLRLLNEFEMEKQKLEMDLLVEQEAEVRKQLARQAGAHNDHLREVLTLQMKQMSQEFDLNLTARVLEEREKFQTEVASWIGRLHGLESAIDARAASEALARGAQDLWLACISLNSSIHFGMDDNSVKPLLDEITAIQKAANKHPFVECVLSSLPEKALERGVYTEETLRARFTKVASVCRTVGLLRDGNRSLYKYLISYIHSYIVLDNLKAVTEEDLVDLESFDNYDLVAHAQYWLDRGNLEIALRFMNQLQGESYIAASDWIKEVKLLLETRQAASSLSAYASATGLANTF